MTTTGGHQQRALVLSLLTLLTAVSGVAFGPTIDASATTCPATGTRVRAIDHPTSALVAAGEPASPVLVGDSGPDLGQLVSATGVATNSAGQFGMHTADDLAASAAGAGTGEYFAAGHALTKHAGGQRAGTSAFPSLSGNPANINQVAQAQIDDILATGRVVTRTHPNHGPIIEVFAPDGRGARWYADGRFFGFLEP